MQLQPKEDNQGFGRQIKKNAELYTLKSKKYRKNEIELN